jgi:riboflavin kinase/FMN adenylyltransferase
MKKIALTGTVTRFKGNGRKLGYPTANMRTKTRARDGVYAGWAWLGEYRRHPAMIFIGTPTMMGDTERRLEAHLLDVPDRDYYGLELRVELAHYLRANRTFPSVRALVRAMRTDAAEVRRLAGDFEQEN